MFLPWNLLEKIRKTKQLQESRHEKEVRKKVEAFVDDIMFLISQLQSIPEMIKNISKNMGKRVELR